MKTSYRLIPISDHKPRIWDTIEEAHEAAYALRKGNKGYFLYEVTEQEGQRRMQLLSGWNPKV